MVMAYEFPAVTEPGVEKVVLVVLPGGRGDVEDGAGLHVTVAGARLPESVIPVRETEPELVTVTAAVPVPEPFGTATSALTWIWFVT